MALLFLASSLLRGFLFSAPPFYFGRNLFLLRESFPELFNASEGIHDLFAAGIKRMAVRANFHLKIFFCGTDRKAVAAGALDMSLRIILRVNILFHADIIAKKNSGVKPLLVINPRIE